LPGAGAQVKNQEPEHSLKFRTGAMANLRGGSGSGSFPRQGCHFGFLKPDFKILDFFGNQEKPDKIWLFSVGKAWLWKNIALSCIFITNLF